MLVNRERRLFEMASEQLQGVGDATLGEWREVGTIAVHLRRRLTPLEMADAGIEAVCDVRGTDEHARRIQEIKPYLPAQMRSLPDAAYP